MNESGGAYVPNEFMMMPSNPGTI